MTEFVVPTRDSQPSDIIAGGDGALWFTEPSGFPKGIGRITTAGVFTEYGLDPVSSLTPNGIAYGPDGNIWFTEFNRNAIGRLEPSGNGGAGTFTFFPLPTAASDPRDIVAGPDGNLYVSGYSAGQLYKVTTSGVITAVQKIRGGRGAWGAGRATRSGSPSST